MRSHRMVYSLGLLMIFLCSALLNGQVRQKKIRRRSGHPQVFLNSVTNLRQTRLIQSQNGFLRAR